MHSSTNIAGAAMMAFVLEICTRIVSSSVFNVFRIESVIMIVLSVLTKSFLSQLVALTPSSTGFALVQMNTYLSDINYWDLRDF